MEDNNLGSENFNDVLLRLVYALEEYKDNGNTTFILGAGCSLASTDNDVSTIGIMKECLYEHNVILQDDKNWEEIYKTFINVVWTGKTLEERRRLLNKRFQGMEPTDGHKILKELIENGYVHNIITTNFDLLIEKACNDLSYLKKTGDNEYVKVGNNNPKFNLLKIHGDLENGILRFSPAELKKLPTKLASEINIKTKGLTLFLGYRGQDIGLINSINETNSSAIYWIDISGPLNQKPFESEQIKDLLLARESRENLLYGKEYGDFRNFLQVLNKFLILKDHKNIIENKKKHIIRVWKDTSIIDMISINSKVYELFINLLYYSQKISRIYSDDNNYLSLLNAYLSFFKNKILPSKLIAIPHNEIDSLMLGLTIEIMARSQAYNISSNQYIDELHNKFELAIENSILFGSSFWDAIKNLLNMNYCCDIDTIKFNFKDKYLNIESIEIPFENLRELMQVIRILSAVNLPYDERSKYKVFSGKQKNIKNTGNKIYIDLGEIELNEKGFIGDFLIRQLPCYYVHNETECTRISSKWLDILFKIKDADVSNDGTIFNLCLERCKETTSKFLSLGVISEEKHVGLKLDYDLLNFISSDKTAIFITGQSGCGKTSSIQNYIIKNKDKFFIAVTSKNNDINRSGISMFLDTDVCKADEDILLKTLDNAFELRQSNLILILDGLNELTFQNQEINYRKIIELSEKLYKLNCIHIKLIVTCRNYAYLYYKQSTGLQLNHQFFYSNDKLEIGVMENQDASYMVKAFDEKEIKLLAHCYIPTNSEFIIKGIQLQNITPLYFAIIGEYLRNHQNIDLDLDNIYKIFSKAMFDRLTKTSVFFAKKIIYSYFDLILKHETINITKFMLEEKLFFENNLDISDKLDATFNELIDINIFVKDSLRNQRIKFMHDKIEEFYFTIYLEENIILDNIILNKIMKLSRNYLIYRGGFVQFLVNKAQDNLGEFKEIIVMNSSSNIDISPKLFIEAISHLKNIDKDLQFLLHQRDYKNSEILLNIIVLGLEDSLLSYSLVTYDLMRIINSILNITNELVNDEIKSYMLFFKSRLYYFDNKYKKALDNINQSLNLNRNINASLTQKIHIHQAIIWMELGYSKNSIDILKIEFNKCKKESSIYNRIRIGVELVRALNHSGQIKPALSICEELLEYEDQTTNSYLLARIYGEKANILNKKTFRELKYGFIPSSKISSYKLLNIEKWFHEAVSLYTKAINLLTRDNDVFCYSGMVPELINSYISYSMSIQECGLVECEEMIKRIENIFKNITTPYNADFNLAKAYYYEYKGDIPKAVECIDIAQRFSKKMKNKFKQAKSNIFYSQFAYRRILNSTEKEQINYWKSLALQCLKSASLYYTEYTKTENNNYIEICKSIQFLLNKY